MLNFILLFLRPSRINRKSQQDAHYNCHRLDRNGHPGDISRVSHYFFQVSVNVCSGSLADILA
jgi:hypothetical protein